MTRNRWQVVLVHGLLIACADAMILRARMPWLAASAVGLLGVSAMAAEVVSAQRWQRFWAGAAGLAWLSSLLVPLSWLRMDFGPFEEAYFALLAWLIAAVVLPANHPLLIGRLGERRKLPVLTCALFCSAAWLVMAYAENRRGAFFCGVLANMTLLVLSKLWLKLPGPLLQAVNTVLLLLAGLSVVDVFIRPSQRLDVNLDMRRPYYSYAFARKYPVLFDRWWKLFLEEWGRMGEGISELSRDPKLPFRLRPNSHARLFQSQVWINSHRFRGKELRSEADHPYRIVVLGESTTFGCTLYAQDKPWTEWLEDFFKERVKTRRPVEVINAGIPSFHIRHNLYRFDADILPAKPDMLVSYHGSNGFGFLQNSPPVDLSESAPAYVDRPWKLLADCEYRVKLLRFKQRHHLLFIDHPAAITNVMQTGYAEAYRQLIQVARTNGIRLVLANYSMAVNRRSDSDVIAFYGQVFTAADWTIQLNEAHSELVEGLCREHPELGFVDTHPQLDGVHEKFIDLVHFTEAGRRQIAENVFAGIKRMVEQDCGEK